ncbi:MAG: molybdenum cofactor guanylyltransferase [Gemmatimonadaceae bacterium]
MTFSPSPPRVTGVILAGGLATRYGGVAKGLVRVGGARIVDRVAAALAAAADDLLLIANGAEADAWLPGVRRAADVLPGQGSLGGLHAALVHAGGAALVVAWDMPFVPASLLSALRALGAAPGVDAAVPESGSRRGVEPLCAYYSPACLPPIERRLAAGDRRVHALFEDVRVARLPAAEVARHGDPSRMFMNVNAPDDLAAAERLVERPTTPTAARAAESHAPSADGGRDRPEA